MSVIEILMVDDDEGDALMAKEAFDQAHIDTNLHIVKDGSEALEYLEKTGEYQSSPTPDIILLDLNMPRMNGQEVLKWVRQHEKHNLIPIIIFTTSSSEKDIVESYEHHANCFITKPLDLKQFNEIIRYIDEFWASIVKLPTKTSK